MTKLYRFVIIFLLGCLTTHGATLPATLDEALDELRDIVKESSNYYAKAEKRIDSLKIELAKGEGDDLRIIRKIANKYRTVNADSCIYYFNLGSLKARAMGDTVSAYLFQLQKSSVLPIIGACIEAERAFDSVPENVNDKMVRMQYLESGHDLFFYLASTYPVKSHQREYAKRAAELSMKLIESLDDSDPWKKLYQAEMSFLNKDYSLVAAYSTEVLESQPYNSHIFALASSILADYYEMQPNQGDNALYYRILAAISDINNGNREGDALHRVALELFSRGDVELAYDCMALSLENSVACGARIRALNTASIMPVIEAAYRERDQKKLNLLTWLVLSLFVALCVIAGVLVVLRREVKAEKRLKKSLKESNMLKESFINQFLSLCSIYMEKLEEFNRMAARKIKAGQVEDLYDTIKSGKMLDEQKVQFCEIFDNAFTKIYPTFVEEINALLQPEKRFTLSGDGSLNTELRILAFMRLGLDDSTKIARFLNLSVNTIYTYRNKLKGKAINRDTFEQSVMTIAQIS